MLKFKIHPLLVRYIRVGAIAVLVVVFGWSGLHKVIDPAGFSVAVFRYHFLPYAAVNIVSLWIAWLELTCAFILLFVSRYRAAALWLILGLLILFSLGIGINLLRGSYMACGCFSSSPMAHPIGWLALLKNLGFMLLATYVLSVGSGFSMGRKDPDSGVDGRRRRRGRGTGY